MGEGLEGISPAQAAQIEPYREHWLQVALSTEPADHERTEEAIRDLYRLVHADPPEFVWCPSPKVAVEVLRERGLEKKYDLYDAMQGVTRAALEDPLGAMLWPSVLKRKYNDPLPTHLPERLATSLAFSIWLSLETEQPGGQELQDIWLAKPGADLWDPICGAVWVLVNRPVRRALQEEFDVPIPRLWGTASDRTIGHYWRGPQDAAWIASCLYADDVLKLGYTARRRAVLDLWAELALHGGWWWPCRHVCVLSERPVHILREPGPEPWGEIIMRLHAEDGPALLYPDGWGVWSIHGVRVPREVVECPERLSPDRIVSELNLELRRLMIERFGAERFLRESGARLIDNSVDGQGLPRRLWRIETDEDPQLLLEVTDSTPQRDGTHRRYVLRVPPDTTSALEAAAWTWQMTPEEYVLDIET